MTTPTPPGLVEALRGFAEGRLDPADYQGHCLALADACEPWLHAFVHRPSSLAGNPQGRLGGIPIGVKDIIATADMPTTCGSPLYQDHRPTADAAVVRRLRDAGGLVFGKTVTTEFAWRHPGPTVNPYRRTHTPGGSSSGSAAAVAAGIVPLALGTQTVGSIIRPAAFCGVVGLKPSFGTISREGVHPFSHSLDHVGLFARSVDDAAYGLGVLADDPSLDIDLAHGVAAVPPPRLLLVRSAMIEGEQRELLADGVARLVAAGAAVEETSLAHEFAEIARLLPIVLAFEAARQFGDLVDLHPTGGISAVLRQLVADGRSIASDAYRQAGAAQTTLRHAFGEALSGFDALLMAPAPGAAPASLANTGDATFCAPWSFTGLPAITLPAGWSARGLPLGLQLAGAWQQDRHLLEVAKWVEATLLWQRRPLDVPRRRSRPLDVP